MMSFDDMFRNQAISSTNDFLELILKTYQDKNNLLKRLYTDGPDTVDSRIMQTREVHKSARGVENLTIPLPSVLKLQIFRAEYVSKMWTSFSFSQRPENFGWKKTEIGLIIKLQNTEDMFYSQTKEVTEGCSCKNICGKACKCLKSKERANKCTSITCR